MRSHLNRILNFARTHRTIIIIGALLVGISLRLVVAPLGYNFDAESYRIVADITERGGNVYAETVRYNYGPVWFTIVNWLDSLSPLVPTDNSTAALHFVIAAFLTVVDVAIFALLLKNFSSSSGAKIAILFFLNPISIIITGYHTQFDNLAILLGLASVFLWYESNKSEQQTSSAFSTKKAISLLVLGLSLMTKHILFVFPLWLALRQKKLHLKVITVFIPVAVFILGFVPFWGAGKDGIIQNVFLYRSMANAPFWNSLFPAIIVNNLPIIILFIATLIVAGFTFRKRPVIEAFSLYLLVTVIFSPAIANQYLAIASIPIAMFPNIFLAAYVAIGTVYLIVNQAGFNIAALGKFVPERFVGYNTLIILLFLGLIWIFRGNLIALTAFKLWKWGKSEILLQLKGAA